MDTQIIVKIDLDNMNLRGPIPSSLPALLPNLYFMNLGNNPQITGPLPTMNPSLKFRRMHNTGLNGDLSATGLFSNGGVPSGLLMLDLSNNYLTGPIPASISTMLPFVKVLDLSSNRLTGQIPQEITLIPSLLSLSLSKNPLTGPIPNTNTPSNFVNLQKLDISTTWVTGSLPTFNNRVLPVLDVQNTYLSGPIPVSLLTSLSQSQNTCPFTNTKLTLPQGASVPSNCPTQTMPFNGQNSQPINVPGIGTDPNSNIQTQPPQPGPSSPASIALILGIVGGVALLLIAAGAALIYYKRRRARLHALRIENASLKPHFPGVGRPFSSATINTLDSSYYGDGDRDRDGDVEDPDVELERRPAGAGGRKESITDPVVDAAKRSSFKMNTSTVAPPSAPPAAAVLDKSKNASHSIPSSAVRWSLAESV